MGSKISLNRIYFLKQIDFFSQPVQFRLQRSKEGGISDQKIGSWFGLFLSVTLVAYLSFFGTYEIKIMNRYEKQD